MKLLRIIFWSLIVCNYAYAEVNYFSEGLEFFNKKKLNEAKFKFEQDLVFNPKNEKSYLYLSKIFNAQDNKEYEEKNLNTVLLLNPKNEEAVYNLAKLKLKQSDYSLSKELADKLISLCKIYCEKANNLKTEIENSQKK
jgi:tetratricopeptide (TPR) repeat protein|tara:strand:- start:1672 stop:2088 length:417 start_codon:yes stop_codon:yes gene_type:complete